ncbi:MAG TPA: hypothetical protein VGU71_20790 [Candidatus Dormibacteraeota bacterium]|nr:hypothetical protein [Candidatus Dormibacteraeota bacterium]
MALSRARFRTFAFMLIVALAAAAVAIQLSAAGQTLKLGGAGFAALHKGDAKPSEQDLAGNQGEPDPSIATLAEEQAINRAIPLDQIPLSSTQAAGQSFDNLDQETDQNNHRRGTWSLLGPTRAFQPGVLAFTGADNVTSGRITSLAISPRCTASSCRLWVGAAGGGIWRTNNALSDNPTWKSVSKGLTTNAIGTIVVDPTDSSGRTLYVGTGEPNASGDSEAGLGLFKSTNGGDSWELVSGSFAVSKSRAISSVVIDPHNSQVIYIGTTRAVRGISSVTGGSTTTDPNGQPAVGLYQTTDGGATWAMIWNGAGTLRGVNHVELNLTDSSTIFASAFQQGIYRRIGGGTFEQIFGTADTGNNAARTEFAVTTKAGHTRIYAGDGGSGPATTGFWRTDNADIAAAALATGGTNGGWTKLTDSANGHTGYATFNYCTGQCWYDNYIVTPRGEPDTVVVLGSYTYGELGGRSNTRSILRSTTAGDPDPTHGAAPGRSFTDLSWDATSATTPNGVHPDQHAFAFVPGNSNIWFEGSDGGLIRSSGSYTDITSQCAGRPIGAASMKTCNWLLSEVPTKLTLLNTGLPTLQFQSLSLNPAHPNGVIMGGTQDNGTWLFTGNRRNWTQTIYGDGGQSGFNVANPAIRFNTFFGQNTDENFQSGDPTKWVVTSGPLYTSKELSAFYMPIIADPSVGGTQFAGLQHVFRTQDSGGNQAFLEANCPEFTAPADKPVCGDWVALGNDLTGLAYGTDRTATPGVASYVVALARGADHSTLWAATRQGRVFVSHNADAADPTTVVFTRIDNLTPASPSRFVSGITVDPINSNHAWLSYSGYNAGTPTTPGHVFEVTFNSASASTTYRNLNVEGLNGDLPITGIVRDNVSGQLFVSTDFGALTWSRENDPAWDVAGSGLPKVEVAGLTYSQSTHTLYAATHGRSAWVMRIESESGDGGHGN